MTALDAVLRAERIWGTRHNVIVTRAKLHAVPGETEWYVDLANDPVGISHGIDCNGHVTCTHKECQAKEDSLTS